jgi:hypothetical protein
MVFTVGGMATRNPFRRTVTMPAEIVYRKEFLAKDGTTQILALDVNGNLYVVAQNGTYTQIDKVAAGSSVNSVTAYGREYMAFFNSSGPTDAPRQWDGKNLYRVSQGGPGAAPNFTPIAISGDSYAIESITQLAPGFSGQLGYFDGIELSAGPGSSSPGNVVTVYTANARAGHFPGGDPVLTDAFNSGNPVNVYVSNLPAQFAQYNGTHLVASIGLGIPNFAEATAERWYFTFIVDDSGYQTRGGSDHAITGQYQITQATMTMIGAVPGLVVGDQVPISGASVADYNSTWTITQSLDSGELTITQTALTGGVATYNYNVLSGIPPTAGQLIAIDGTLNANGALDGDNLTIATATGGNSGSFTINGFDPSVTFPPTAENASGITAGTQFVFDPMAIYGDSEGGTITFSGTAVAMAPGTRLAFPFFIMATGLTTQAGPITKFTIPANTSAIAYSNLAIGPANVIARGIAFTGANGGNYFYLPIIPQINGEILGTSTVVNDNTTTAGTMNFTDDALLSGLAVDIPGNNLFQQVALNLPRGVNWYGDRVLWIGEANTVVGILNMGMDGGTLPGSPYPLGWKGVGALQVTQDGIMPVLSGVGSLTQNAAKTGQGVAIIKPDQNYSLRAWFNNGVLSASLTSSSTGFSASLSMGGSGYITATFSQKLPAKIPDDLTLTVTLSGGTMRDMHLIYADNPNRNPVARMSYVRNPEAYDALTGNVGPNDDSTELRATFVLQESMYFVTQRGLYGVQQIGNTEPSSWYPTQIADKCGAYDANSTITGKGWAAWGGPEGFQWFSGRVPSEISAVIRPTWSQFSGMTGAYNDAIEKRVYLGTIDGTGNKGLMTYDYKEVEFGGAGKWCPWNRRLNSVSKSSSGTIFAFGASFYYLDTAVGTDDDDLGQIGGYYTLPPIGVSMFRTLYSYIGLRITGAGLLSPFVYAQTLQAITATLNAQELSTLIDTVAEWPMNNSGRLMFLKVGQPGARYSLEDATFIYADDPNSPVSGIR